MKKTERDKISAIESDPLREIAEYLLKTGKRITYFGQAWTKAPSTWIYFDTVLDIYKLKDKFQLHDHIVIHENSDPKSGTEKGFVDKNTGEGLMGKLK